ncbi:hypothetical protein K474DRAFT_1595819, partial [Panus rudis PR-1116 ss-1]
LLFEKKSFVSNFIAGVLPRPDTGVREDYCLTMLTLFKPWRSGKELKAQDESWNEAFDNMTFTQQQKDLMKFFNIRYECNDVRDDFAAQRKAGFNKMLLKHIETSEFEFADENMS